jgi:hypothetical protein
VSSSVPIAKAQSQESPVGEQPCGEVNVAFAVHFLGTSPEAVIGLCKTGELLARRNKHGTWRLDEAFLVRWREANPNAGAASCEASESEEQRALPTPGAPSSQRVPLPCPPGVCEGHWERRGRVVPEFRAGLCRRCFSGRPLPVRPDGDASMD